MKYCVIMLFALFLSSCDAANKDLLIEELFIPNYRVIELQEFTHINMTDIVGENIQLTAQLTWDNGGVVLAGHVNEDDKLYATALEMVIPESLFEIPQRFLNQQRTHIRVEGLRLSTDWIGKQESYLYQGKLLQKNHYYVLFGHFSYREWLGVNEEILGNEEFINQSNNPVYWSQTFKFVVDHLTER